MCFYNVSKTLLTTSYRSLSQMSSKNKNITDIFKDMKLLTEVNTR